ncbi:MAG: hypothetical protein ACJ71W_16050 [Terriglobales bacterium]
MSPEAPGNLVILDLSYDEEKQILFTTVEEVVPDQGKPPEGWLRVRFDEAPGEKFEPVGGGVAHVRRPPGYEHGRPTEKSEVLSLPGTDRYIFSNVAQGDGLQLIAILPSGYTLSEFKPSPTNAKEFKGRIAVYFRPKEHQGQTATIIFCLKKFEGAPKAEAQRLRAEFLRDGSTEKNMGAFVDREDPQFKPPLSAKAYAWIALGGLIIGIGLLLFYVYAVPKLVKSGSQNQVYYLLLIPWALASAAFLFGAMRSYATLKHKYLGTVLELGGPVVLFCLVIWGGYYLVPQPPARFDLKVRASSKDGAVPIFKAGKVTIDVGRGLEEHPIESSGEAYFFGVDAHYRAVPIKALADVGEGYTKTWQEKQVDGDVLHLELERSPIHQTSLKGSIDPAPTDWKQIRIVLDGKDGQMKETTVDELGRFEFSEVDGDKGDQVDLKVYAGRKLIYYDSKRLPGPVSIPLDQ